MRKVIRRRPSATLNSFQNLRTLIGIGMVQTLTLSFRFNRCVGLDSLTKWFRNSLRGGSCRIFIRVVPDFSEWWFVLKPLERLVLFSSTEVRMEYRDETKRKCWSCDEDYEEIYNGTLLTNKDGTKCGLQNKN